MPFRDWVLLHPFLSSLFIALVLGMVFAVPIGILLGLEAALLTAFVLLAFSLIGWSFQKARDFLGA
ncbi:MAG: hypothetical protein AABX97_00620 [Candidatus Thermoplasmatota archaeon]